MRGHYFVGIDVGTSPSSPGAIAVLDREGRMAYLFDMPFLKTEVTVKKNKSGVGYRTSLDMKEMVAIFNQIYLTQGQNIRKICTALEAQTVYTTDGRRSGGTLMQTFGRIEGMLTAYGAPYEAPGPKQWQAHFSLTGDKDSHRNLAAEMFGLSKELKRLKDHGRADALLIAEYVRWKELMKEGTDVKPQAQAQVSSRQAG